MSTPLAPIGGGAGVSMDTSRLASKENLDAAGERFEAMFTGMMLKSMRSAKLSEGLFDSQALDQFRDMQDEQLARTMAAHAPIGIGKAMTEFLSRSATLESASGQPPADAGSGGPA